ncbi:hypothetical protein [Bacillus sp. SRB_331]|uniref:hypothetical protein n=1 Tax=Bacillus sp. SRB_331 TaxID=1969379 RepID=UPI000DC3A70A|nr:hypothetical protein [Bacillus sp. SRB_331]RAN80592.1 hypothetical protein B5P42_13670 [Bacillus sp. SRB_331]
MKQKLMNLLVIPSVLVGFTGVHKTLAAYTIDKDCEDFQSQKEAQIYFLEQGGSINNNVNRLDVVRNDQRNGIACDKYPYQNKERYEELTLPGQGDNNNGSDMNNGFDMGNGMNENNNADNGGEMPNTTTSYGNYAVFCLGMILTGLFLIIHRKRSN